MSLRQKTMPDGSWRETDSPDWTVHTFMSRGSRPGHSIKVTMANGHLTPESGNSVYLIIYIRKAV